MELEKIVQGYTTLEELNKKVTNLLVTKEER